jgi:hypothetical protein
MSSASCADLFLPGVAPFALSPAARRDYLRPRLAALTRHHRSACAPYARLVGEWDAHRGGDEPEDQPFLPVTLFKEYELRSTAGPAMRLHSSSTTSDRPSRIFVDQATRLRQSLSANRILADFLGDQRRPYLVFDVPDAVRGADALTARGAAILSLAHLASDVYFVGRMADGDVVLDEARLAEARQRIGGQPFLAYGFTFVLFQMHERWSAGPAAAHPDSRILHSGGWKRLAHLAVDRRRFNETIAGAWGLAPEHVLDFYGLVEQAGIPYPDCAAGFKHPPYWADVIVRRTDSLEPAGIAEKGLLQLVSCLPLSAPNHSVITEDLAELVLLDGCACGRRGKAFVFRGRAPRAAVRGCSDVPRR